MRRPRRRLASPAVRLIVARCSVDYSGRLTARLPEALRLIMRKADGSVLVHADAGGYKPLNEGFRRYCAPWASVLDRPLCL